jgi:hypothetical protein
MTSTTPASEGERLPSAEFQFRGLPADKREEIGRRVVKTFWAFASDGAEVGEKQVAAIETIDEHNGWLSVIDTNPSSSSLWTLPEITAKNDYEGDRADHTRRRVRVIRRQLVETEYLEHRSAFNPVALRHEVVLPSVLPVGGDPRMPRETIKLRHAETVSSATAASEAV